jgi:hypothetical protein
MTKLGKKSDGFGAVEGLLILIIICLVVFIGYYVWHTNKDVNKTEKATNTAATATKTPAKTDSYAGWNSYTLKNEKLSFRYPSGWKLEDDSQGKTDELQLTATDGFVLSITAGGLGHPSSDGPLKVYEAESIKFAGRPAYLDYVGQPDSGLVYEASVSKSATDPIDTLPSETSGENADGNGNLVITLLYGTDSDANGKPLAAIKSDNNTKQAKLVLASMHY